MTTLTVGAGQAYATIHDAVAAAKNGDVVQVQAGTYVNDFATVDRSITLQAVGGMAHLVATEEPPDGKAILTVGKSNTNISITGFEFSGAAVGDGNGAGIRYQGGNLTLTNTYFHDNQDGLLANADPNGTITILNSEFSHNGTGDGATHNLYVGGDLAQLTIDGSYFHDAVVGHEIKSRASNTTITNSRIFDNGGNASYSIDLPQGGNARIENNIIQQGANSENPTIIAYGEEGYRLGLRAGTSLVVNGNTVVNDLASGSARLLWNASGATATVSNESVYGLNAGQIVLGSANVSGTTFLSSHPTLDRSSPWRGASSGTSPGDTSPGDTSSGGTGTSTGSSGIPTNGSGTTGSSSGTYASSTVDSDAFDPAYYLQANPDVAAAGVNARDHFNQYGWHEGRKPDALFDVNYYLSHNQDVAAAGINPLAHYSQNGWREGRDPSAQFDTSAYLGAYRDVAAAGMNPLVHYLRYGAAEGRAAFSAPA